MLGFVTGLYFEVIPNYVASILEQPRTFDFTTFLRNIINGLNFGSIYALVALGIVLIYKSSDVVNFGTADMSTMCTFIAFALVGFFVPKTALGALPEYVNTGLYFLILLGALAFAALLGFVIERFLLRPLAKSSVISQVMLTIGLGIFLFGISSLIWKADTKAFPQPEILEGGPVFRIGDIPVTREVFAAIVVGGIISLLLFLFFKYTLVGTAMRAMAQNPTAARLMGVNVGNLTGLTWMLSMMMGAIAGMLIAPLVSLNPNMMAAVAINGFAAAVLGGLTSLPGAVVGGLLMGIIDNLVGFYAPDGLRGMGAFVIIVLVLTFKPNGLLGKTVRKKV
jgi:branched-chain amino acid transport system permease protein